MLVLLRVHIRVELAKDYRNRALLVFKVGCLLVYGKIPLLTPNLNRCFRDPSLLLCFTELHRGSSVKFSLKILDPAMFKRGEIVIKLKISRGHRSERVVLEDQAIRNIKKWYLFAIVF